jgi:tubulin-specific chaperone C
LNTKKSELTPKSKFSFKSRSTAASTSASTSSAKPAGLATNAPSTASNESVDEKPSQHLANAHIISSLSSAYHEPALDEPKDVLIRDITESIVNFFPLSNNTTNTKGKLTTLHLQNIQSSIILTGPVKGSVMIENCHHSIILTACRQFRMHKSNDTRVFLLCGSNPIVEDVSGISFGPYFLFDLQKQESALEWLRQEFTTQNISVNADHYNHYTAVQDFNWIKATASQNWRLLEEEEVRRVRDGLAMTDKLKSLGGHEDEEQGKVVEEWMKVLQKKCTFIPI